MSSSSISSGGSTDLTNVTSVFEALAKRSKLLMGLTALVVVVVGVFALISNQNEQKSDAGRNALYLATKSLDTQLEAIAKASAPAETAQKNEKAANKEKKAPSVTPDAVMFKKMDVDTQLADSVSKLKAVTHDYASTHSGFEAMLELGKLYLNHGEPAEAADWFQKAADHAPTTLDRAIAWESAGFARENEGKAKDAVEAFEKGLSAGETTIKGDLMLDKARALETAKDVAQAKSVYEQIKTQLPNTDYAKTAELYEARLGK